MKRTLYAIAITVFTALALSCGRSPLMDPPSDSTNNSYAHPEITNVYPADGSALNATNTEYAIVFNTAVDPSTIPSNISISSATLGMLSEGADYTITVSPGNTAVSIRFTSVFPNNDTVTITFGTGIATTEGGTLDNPGARTFSVGTVADNTAPTISAGSEIPADGSLGIPTGQAVSLQFIETGDINAATLNPDNFYIRDDSKLPALVKVTAALSYDSGAKKATLAPSSPLQYVATYTVFVTTGVTDLSGNALAAGTSWSFTTEIFDPVPGSPAITSGITIDGVTDKDAFISWTTSEDTNYMLSYGRNNDGGSLTLDDLITFMSSHILTLPSLTAGKRYYAKVDYQDVAGNSGATSTVAEFNTLTAEVPDILSDGTNDQHQINTIENQWAISPGGVFAFWTSHDASNNRHIYGQLFDNTATSKWAAGGAAIFAKPGTDYYYLSSVEDEVGGAIVLVSVGGTGIYAMRIDELGAVVNWGPDADDPSTDLGIQIDPAGTNATAVPMYAEMVQPVATGTTEHGSLSMPNWFYDHDADLTGVNNNDMVMDPNNHDGTTIITTGQDHMYFAGQTNAVIQPGDTYLVGSGTTTITGIAQNHALKSGPVYNTGLDNVYTIHNYSDPAWAGFGSIIKHDGTGDFTRILSKTAYMDINPLVASGTSDSINIFQLIDSIASFIPAVNSNCIVKNLSTGNYSGIVNVVNATTLDLDINIFTLIGQNYEIYPEYCVTHYPAAPMRKFVQYNLNYAMNFSAGDTFTIYDYTGVTGTADTPPSNGLYDNDADFPAAGASNGNIALNVSTNTSAAVTTGLYAIHPKALDLDTAIFGDAEDYGIIRFTVSNTGKSNVAATGKASVYSPGHLVDSTSPFGTVKAGNVAYNLDTGKSALVTNVSAIDDLRLSQDIFTAANERYVITNQRGVLYIWQNGTSIWAKMLGMEGWGSTPPVLKNTWLFASNAVKPVAISDGMGNALVVYETVTGQIMARKYDSTGSTPWSMELDDQGGFTESLIKVVSDGAGGLVALYTVGTAPNNLRIQWMTGLNGNKPWGANGITLPNPGTPTSIDMAYNAATQNCVVVAAISGDIWAAAGGTSWNWSRWISQPAFGTQKNPKVLINTAAPSNSRIVWEDDRFSGFAGYGIFGMRIDATTGDKSLAWYADDTSTDLEGIAFVLNELNIYWPNIRLAPYGTGGNAILFWEDWRTVGESANLLFENDIFSFLP